ncbi:glycoside hydrolase family 15 protein [Calderihabitans maritimus]|uniref:GH15-like domain-containing protein n=1 Tax=Calderihabitans maritimus TaxID=1246530 RepID=A0A1Z5HQ63_9FIRM|nr:glycoside hydrolase family 15 protein [Calderihabitans maritimus]GAW91578.1 hypothetical protein KKC1_07390 [Calderihabitans maritimus]
MPRYLVLGNGKMLVNFDQGLNMRDLYYPYVGAENHINGNKNRIGIWVDNSFSWIDEEGWKRELGYLKDTLVTQATAWCEELGVSLSMNDAVHFRHNVYLKRVTVSNLKASTREVRIFFTHDFSINGTEVGDTALYDPTVDAIYHYKRDRYFLINGISSQGGIYQYSVGIKRFAGAEGTWRDAEDGHLEGNPIAQGSVDSAISFRIILEPYQTEELYYWIAVGRNFQEVRQKNQYVFDKKPSRLLERIKTYWRTWVHKYDRDFADLSPKIMDLFHLSLLVVRTQVDQGGAIIAANDTDILKVARDHYSYMWPRDGALVAWALDRAGYPEITSSFYRFCQDILTEGGYLLHKYNPDGSVGSSWHPWIREGEFQLPIQEDETALVLIALWYHYRYHRNFEFIEFLYKPLVRKAANFMVEYRDPSTGLPKESYDLWEERRGIFTFTAAAVYGALKAAANFARLFNDRIRIERYEEAAAEVKKGILNYLYSRELNRFLRGIYFNEKGEIIPDVTLESSLYGIFAFGVLEANDPRVVSTMNAIEKGLWVKTQVGGVARYTNDYYFRKSDDIKTVPGNPWVICTLWLADWYIAKATTEAELQRARMLLEWVADHTMESGLLPEQLHPYTGEPESVAPLTWSHGTFISSVLAYVEKARSMRF